MFEKLFHRSPILISYAQGAIQVFFPLGSAIYYQDGSQLLEGFSCVRPELGRAQGGLVERLPFAPDMKQPGRSLWFTGTWPW
jgi:hypothetical protein